MLKVVFQNVSYSSMGLVVTMAGIIAGMDLTAAPVPALCSPTRSEVEKKLHRSWYEAGKVVAGKPLSKHRFGPKGWKFDRDEAKTWELYGELTTNWYRGGAVIDITTMPWRLDIHKRDAEGNVIVMPGIFKFEGETLIWVTEYPGGWHRLSPTGDYKGRPKSFESTKENRYTRRVLKPCQYLQTQFP